MLISFVINVLLSIINFILGLLPSADPAVTAKLNEQITPFRNLLVSNKWWFPVNDFFWLIGTFLTITGVLVLWLIIRFVGHGFSFGAVK